MKIKKIFTMAVITVLSMIFTSVFAFESFATGTADFSIPKGAVDKGSTFSVSVKVTADNTIGVVTGMISYDDSVLEFKPSDNASGGGGVVTLNGFPDSADNKLTFKINFKALKSGKCKLELSNCFITSDDGTQIGSSTAYANITVGNGVAASTDDDSANDISSDADKLGDPDRGYLTSLTVSNGTLKPAFSYDIYDYYVDVDNSVDICEIEGKTANATDRIWYTGNENLIVGKNVRTIKVTDTDGYYHIYTITITRAAQNEDASIDENTYQDSSLNNASDSSTLIIEDNEDKGIDQYKNIIIPAMIIVVVTLIIAAVVILTWLRKKKNK